MLNAEIQARVKRMVAFHTGNYRHAKGMGYDVQKMALPSYPTQEDFDQYRPEDAGNDFEEENEFVMEILKGLLANGVPATVVTIHVADYKNWLNERQITTDTRATYCAYLLAKEETGQ
jgi:hypothetical protein